MQIRPFMTTRLHLRVLTLFALLLPAAATPPAWWGNGYPPILTGSPENNQGPANIGQAKWMVAEALRALDIAAPTVASLIRADLAGTAPAFANRIIDLAAPANPKPAAWIEQQKAPLLIGQLKAISTPFYTRLSEANPATSAWLTTERITNGTHTPDTIFPWTAATTDDANKAIATIGQLKAVFSLRFETMPPDTDSDGDGIPDWWEVAYLFDPYDSNNASIDPDVDSFNNLQEYGLGTSPLIHDTLADTDLDRMPDVYEIANGLNLNLDDTLEDNDGDRVPNFYEFKHGTRANSKISRPPATLVVDPAAASASSTDHIYATIREAITRARGDYNQQTGLFNNDKPFSVIEVKAGIYREQLYADRPMLLLGELGTPWGPPTISGSGDVYATLGITTASVVDGFIITHEPGKRGNGVTAYRYNYDLSYRCRIVNCVLRGNEGLSYYPAGGINNQQVKLDVVHCTITGNKSDFMGRGITNSGTLNLINSIVWGNTGTGAEIHNESGSTVNITSSIVANGEHGGINEDPQLIPFGWLKSTSPAINRSGIVLNAVSVLDIHGEVRPVAGGTPDLGADEYKDNNGMTDGDSLPDWAEGLDDNDGLTALDEYTIHGTIPFVADTDGDGLSDGFEISHGFNPLVPNSTVDSDGGGIPETWKSYYGLNHPGPFNVFGDPDLDGLNNLQEYQRGTSPINRDTDGDTLPDGWEVSYNLSPTDNGSVNPANGLYGIFPGSTSTNGFAYINLPNVQNSNGGTLENFDGDLAPNDQDSDPTDRVVDWPPVAATSYAVIPLGHLDPDIRGVTINTSGVILTSYPCTNITIHNIIQSRTRIWKNGIWSSSIPVPVDMLTFSGPYFSNNLSFA